MPDICPTITVETRDDYERQLNVAKLIAGRIHIDLADGTMTARQLLSLIDMSWPKELKVDLHIMSNTPGAVMASINLKCKPQLVIIHAEAEGNFVNLASRLKRHDIRVGVALLQATGPEIIKPALDLVDHVLIFSGNLGYQGGSTANMDLLSKAQTLKAWKPELEIGWDGGVSDANIKLIADGGVDIINVGGYIQSSNDPKEAYAKLASALDNKNAA